MPCSMRSTPSALAIHAKRSRDCGLWSPFGVKKLSTLQRAYGRFRNVIRSPFWVVSTICDDRHIYSSHYLGPERFVVQLALSAGSS